MGPVSEAPDPRGTLTFTADTPIHIAVVTAGSPPGLAAVGSEQEAGAEQALTDSGTDLPIVLETFQDGCDAESAAAIADSIAAAGDIIAVVGHTCSTACEAAAPIYEAVNITMISPSCGASTLVDTINYVDSFTRTIHDDQLEGTLAASFAFSELGARTALLIDDGTVNTVHFTQAFSTQFRSVNGSVVVAPTFDDDEDWYTQMLAFVQDGQVGVIYAPLLPDSSALLLEQLQAAQVDVPLIAHHMARSGWMGDQAAGYPLYATGPYLEQDRFASASYWASYDATALLLNALGEVAQQRGDSIHVGQQALRDAITSTSSYQGATGLLTCTPQGDCSASQLAVARLNDSGWQVVFIPR
ncbi:MAG: ABC transporter substrate-binding protein [Anaerolineae bacterium]